MADKARAKRQTGTLWSKQGNLQARRLALVAAAGIGVAAGESVLRQSNAGWVLVAAMTIGLLSGLQGAGTA